MDDGPGLASHTWVGWAVEKDRLELLPSVEVGIHDWNPLENFICALTVFELTQAHPDFFRTIYFT